MRYDLHDPPLDVPTCVVADRVYNYSVYTSNTLFNGEHTFDLQPRGDRNPSFLVFDYFSYEHVLYIRLL